MPSYYFFDTHLKIFICKEHHIAIPRRNLQRHTKEAHLTTEHEAQENGFKQALGSLELRSLEQVSQELKSKQPVRPIPFLEHGSQPRRPR